MINISFQFYIRIPSFFVFLSLISSYSFAAVDYKCERTKLRLQNWTSTVYAKKLMPEILYFRVVPEKKELVTSIFGKDNPFRISDDVAQRWLNNSVRNMRVILDMSKLQTDGTIKWGGRHAHKKFRQVHLSSYKCKKL